MKIKALGKTYPFLSLEEIKKHLRIPINFVDDDVQLNTLLMVATDLAANYIENNIALTDFQATQEEFSGQLIDIDRGHFHSLQSIEYTDKETGQKVTLSGDVGYKVSAEEFVFLITLDQPINAENLKVNFQCGYDAETIEPTIKQAILIKLTDLYDIERASYNSGSFQLNDAFHSLLNYHKQIRMF